MPRVGKRDHEKIPDYTTKTLAAIKRVPRGPSSNPPLPPVLHTVSAFSARPRVKSDAQTLLFAAKKPLDTDDVAFLIWN